MPQTLSELFQEYPHFVVLEPYIPNFRFLFQDASRLRQEELRSMPNNPDKTAKRLRKTCLPGADR